jgi:hypothetical protein
MRRARWRNANSPPGSSMTRSAYGGVPLISPAQAVALRAAHPPSGPELTRDSYRYEGFRRTNPRYPTIYRAYHRTLETVLAERDRRAAGWRASAS